MEFYAMISPPFLRKKDLIVIAPSARFVTEEEMDPVRHFLESEGFRVEYVPGLFNRCHQFAGSDSDRANALQWALDHPEAKAILIARGGYGSVRIIDHLDFSLFLKHPKWVTGFSDITVLHARLHSLGICSLHAPLASTLLKDTDSAQCLIKTWKGEIQHIDFPVSYCSGALSFKGIITGGNLSVLYSLCGSPDDIKSPGKILFLEDVDEYLYHIDRMLRAMFRAGKWKKLSGILMGDFSQMKDHEIPFGESVSEMMGNIVKETALPVVYGFPAGHGTTNLPLMLGKTVEISVSGNKGILKYL